MFAFQLTLLNKLAVADFYRIGNQAVAGSEREIIPQVFVAVEIDLAGQMFMTRRGNEEMDMRRTVTVTPQLVKEFLRWPIRRATVAGWHNAAHAIAAIGAGANAAAQIIFTLALIEERVVPEGIGMPDINDSVGYRVALGVKQV